MELFLWLGRNKMRPEYSFSSLYRTGGGAGNRGGRRSDQSHGPETVAILPSSSQAGIIYYSKEKYFRHVQQAAAVGLEKFNNDPVLQFFKAYGVLGEGEDPSVLPLTLGPHSAVTHRLHLDGYFYPSHVPLETVLHRVARFLG